MPDSKTDLPPTLSPEGLDGLTPEQKAKVTLRYMWSTYQKVCIPAHASRAQILATRDAFFGGAKAMFSLTLLSADIDEALGEDASSKHMQALHNELEAYMAESLKAGLDLLKDMGLSVQVEPKPTQH